MFYYKEKSLRQKDFIYDILNNLKNGIVLYNVDKHKTNYFNNCLMKYKEFSNEMTERSDIVITKENEDFINKNIIKDNISDSFKDVNIFRHIKTVNQELPPELIEAFSTNSYTEINEMIKSTYCFDETNIFFDTCLFLGFVELNCEDGTTSLFEFYVKGVNSFQGIIFQYMLNDVTKTKNLQEKLSREKTLLLGKISHEFKNPCIVITESVEELKEMNESSIQDHVLSEKLQFLSNLSQYMIMLIKDFEVLASIENQLNVDIFPVEFSTLTFLNDIDEIVNTLIKKKNAKELKFKLNLDNSIDTITTDCLRLKQILINLLSNSVKFSEKGTIELKLEKHGLPHSQSTGIETRVECISKIMSPTNNKTKTRKNQPYIKFSIIDSGKGLSDDFINNFNNNIAIKKENTLENSLGTGYGLGIVQNLCKILGTTIQVENNSPNGSVFHFSIYQDKLNENNLLNQKTMFNIDDDDAFDKVSIPSSNMRKKSDVTDPDIIGI